jgi:hypoxanthine phosphoribosyltransferase
VVPGLADDNRVNVIPAVTFDDLSKQANVIFVGDVVDTRAFTLRTRRNMLVKTRVTAIYGAAAPDDTFRPASHRRRSW